jgi:integrase
VSFNCIPRPRTAQLFSVAAEAWLKAKVAHLSPRSVIIERANLKHINPYFGKILLCDVSADDIARYQADRIDQSAAAKTVNLEVGTLRAILRKNRLWASIQPDVRMLRAREDVGRAISRDEEGTLLEACRASRSRSLYPAVLIALNTCMRYSELRLLRWGQVHLKLCTLTVGISKTESGTGRLLPLNDRAVAILGFWASLFPLGEQIISFFLRNVMVLLETERRSYTKVIRRDRLAVGRKRGNPQSVQRIRNDTFAPTSLSVHLGNPDFLLTMSRNLLDRDPRNDLIQQRPIAPKDAGLNHEALAEPCAELHRRPSLQLRTAVRCSVVTVLYSRTYPTSNQHGPTCRCCRGKGDSKASGSCREACSDYRDASKSGARAYWD